MAVSEARASHGPEAAFARAVQDAMAHLYDPITLQRHPLATRLRPGASGRTAHLGKALRQALLDAMAALRPPTKAGEHSAAWRRYRLLELRYVEALDPTGVQQQLGIAKTHYYREHRHALTALASLLAPAFAPLPAAAPPDGAPHGATIADAAITHGEMAAPATAPTVIRDAPTRLPAYLTSFIGRQQELADLVRLLTCQEGARPARLITLLGAGGAGKTRLAVEVAAALPAHACVSCRRRRCWRTWSRRATCRSWPGARVICPPVTRRCEPRLPGATICSAPASSACSARSASFAAAAQAARLLGAASALRAAMGVPVPPSARDDYERTVASVQGALGKSAFHAAWAAGQQITLEEAIAEALATPLPPPPPEPPAAGDQPAEA